MQPERADRAPGTSNSGVRMAVDVVVVGAGSAGCVLASRLSEDAARAVLLVEAGPDYPTLGELPDDIADASQPTLSHDWGYLAEGDSLGRVASCLGHVSWAAVQRRTGASRCGARRLTLMAGPGWVTLVGASTRSCRTSIGSRQTLTSSVNTTDATDQSPSGAIRRRSSTRFSPPSLLPPS